MLKVIGDVYKGFPGGKRFIRIALESGIPNNEDYKIFPITSAEAINAVSVEDIRNILQNTGLDFLMDRIEEVLERQGKKIDYKSEILKEINEKKRNVTEIIEITIRIPKGQ